MQKYSIYHKFTLFNPYVGITSSNGIVGAMKDPKKYDGTMGSPGPQDPQQPRHQSWLQKITGKKTPTKRAGPVEVSFFLDSSYFYWGVSYVSPTNIIFIPNRFIRLSLFRVNLLDRLSFMSKSHYF